MANVKLTKKQEVSKPKESVMRLNWFDGLKGSLGMLDSVTAICIALVVLGGVIAVVSTFIK